MDIGTISLVLLIGMLILLAIGMPLGFASGFLAVVVMVLKFGPDLLFGNFGTGPLNILGTRIYGHYDQLRACFSAVVHIHGEPVGTVKYSQRYVQYPRTLDEQNPRGNCSCDRTDGHCYGCYVRHYWR